MARHPAGLNDISEEKIKKVQLQSVAPYDRDSYDLNDEKDFTKYIKDIERVIRSSFEYQKLISYLHYNAGMDRCAFLPNVSNAETFKIKIEIHHEPFTLYDIVMAVFKKRSDMREDLSVEMVSKEVMYLHYQLWVGLVPLCETVHDLVHNQYIMVPSTIVFGKYKKFMDMYKKYIEPETLNTVMKIEEISKDYDMDAVRKILEPNIIGVEAEGITVRPEEALQYIKAKLDELNAKK